jgi:acetolactate synthase small subunit
MDVKHQSISNRSSIQRLIEFVHNLEEKLSSVKKTHDQLHELISVVSKTHETILEELATIKIELNKKQDEEEYVLKDLFQLNCLFSFVKNDCN